MADIDGADDEVATLDEPETEETEGEQPEAKPEEGAAETDEVVVTIGDESPPSEEADESAAPEWVRELRKSNKEKDKELRKQAARIRELEGQSAPANKAAEVGVKPTLESCEYDTDKFEAQLEAWHQRKYAAEAESRKKEESERAAKDAWQAKLDAYGKAKATLKVSDFEDAEAIAQDVLSVTQQGIVLDATDRPELVIYALGKNPTKAKELAAISNPVKFAGAVAKLEEKLKVKPKQSVPAPERVITGKSGAIPTTDKRLAELEAKAEKTGDRTEVIKYKAKLKAVK